MFTKFLLICFFPLTFLACSHENTYEDELYTCMKTHYSAHRIELDAALDSLEDQLIEQGLLQSRDGEGKLEVFRKIAADGDFLLIEQTDLVKRLQHAYARTDELIACTFNHRADSARYFESLYYRKSEQLAREMDKKQVTPEKVAKAMTACFSAEDLELPYFRAQVLISWIMAADAPTTLRIVPKEPDVPEETRQGYEKSKSNYRIQLTGANELLVNDATLDAGSLEHELSQFLHSAAFPVAIHISVHKTTSYTLLVSTWETVEKCKNAFYDRFSRAQFQQDFSKLSDAEQAVIRDEHPIYVVEHVIR